MKMTDLLKAGGVAGALFAATTLSTGAAHAVAVTGGTTAVTVTADLAGLGLTPGLEGSATAEVNDGLLTVFFPITGGSTGPAGNALIEHEGSGVSLTAEDGTTASVGNFVIKTSAVDGVRRSVRGDDRFAAAVLHVRRRDRPAGRRAGDLSRRSQARSAACSGRRI